ncbi:hypothetical protein EIP91_011662 [Steccherinum ochraceum]|uniref:RBR-type E3 ubiquitin transferase n=1 Tax=Steccherinum ochraceum TaxID=92696 RepID=A0A4R0RLW7_9APHY|nr:hypothetical protein EIP91_011662 [Steccherinum ochraceum]
MSDYSDAMSEMYDSDGSGFEDFQDNDSDYDIPVASTKGKEKMATLEYQTLSPERLQDTIDDDIRRVASISGLESPIASILLQHFRFNEDRLLEKFMDSPAAVLKEAGEPPEPPSTRPTKRTRLTPTEFVCGICCDTPSADEVFKLRCDHAFCKACWEMYVTSKVKEEGQCFFSCMQDGCATIVDDTAVAKLTDVTGYERFKELIRRSYVSANTNLRYCPHPSCTETVSCAGGRGESLLTEVPIVRCGKEHSFCFGCGLDSDHRPLICKLIDVWVKNAREDAGTTQWMKANTKQCPKCGNNIEKNGGCNRIPCRHCQYQFCWLCMQKWETHGYNNEVCNAWKEPEPDEATSEAQRNLSKWLFYFDRFNNHELSAKLDQELCERAESKMLEIQETGKLSWIESKFMQDAVDELTMCRVSLKWSYAMAYFLKQGNQKEIFEDIQADLEKAVEELSQMLEEEIEDESVKALRLRTVDKTVYVRGRHEILLQDTAAGLAEGRWEWNVTL